MKTIKLKLLTVVATLALATSAAVAAPANSGVESISDQKLVKQVRHELVTLPYFGVFDNLTYKVRAAP